MPNEIDDSNPEILVNMTCINITLSKRTDQVDLNHYGYQDPLTDSEYEKF